MKHQIKKVKIKFGKDSNKIIEKKLIRNFIYYGKIETTSSKAQLIKSRIDRLVNKAKLPLSQALIYLNRYLNSKKLCMYFIEQVKKNFLDKNSGFVSVKKINVRRGDGSLIYLVKWTKPILSLFEAKNKKQVKNELKLKSQNAEKKERNKGS